MGQTIETHDAKKLEENRRHKQNLESNNRRKVIFLLELCENVEDALD
jgi:hypothetical protein